MRKNSFSDRRADGDRTRGRARLGGIAKRLRDLGGRDVLDDVRGALPRDRRRRLSRWTRARVVARLCPIRLGLSAARVLVHRRAADHGPARRHRSGSACARSVQRRHGRRNEEHRSLGLWRFRRRKRGPVRTSRCNRSLTASGRCGRAARAASLARRPFGGSKARDDKADTHTRRVRRPNAARGSGRRSWGWRAVVFDRVSRHARLQIGARVSGSARRFFQRAGCSA